MINPHTNAIAALLSEYQRALDDLKRSFLGVKDEHLNVVADKLTLNDDCRSIASILTHVVSSGYSYCIYIRNSRGDLINRPPRNLFATAYQYIVAIDLMFDFTVQTFETITDKELEIFDEDKKIKTGWGQVYDIEQLFEHAIVHVLRHRRQIENFKKILA